MRKATLLAIAGMLMLVGSVFAQCGPRGCGAGSGAPSGGGPQYRGPMGMPRPFVRDVNPVTNGGAMAATAAYNAGASSAYGYGYSYAVSAPVIIADEPVTYVPGPVAYTAPAVRYAAPAPNYAPAAVIYAGPLTATYGTPIAAYAVPEETPLVYSNGALRIIHPDCPRHGTMLSEPQKQAMRAKYGQ